MLNIFDKNLWLIFLLKLAKRASNNHFKSFCLILTQPVITCSKLTIETPEQSVKYVQS